MVAVRHRCARHGAKLLEHGQGQQRARNLFWLVVGARPVREVTLALLLTILAGLFTGPVAAHVAGAASSSGSLNVLVAAVSQVPGAPTDEAAVHGFRPFVAPHAPARTTSVISRSIRIVGPPDPLEQTRSLPFTPARELYLWTMASTLVARLASRRRMPEAAAARDGSTARSASHGSDLRSLGIPAAVGAGPPAVVNVADDGEDSQHHDGVCDDSNAAGLQCSFRAAIETTQDAGGGTIVFAGPFNIKTTSVFPGITVPVLIDATTFSGYSAVNSVSLTRGASVAVSHGLRLECAGPPSVDWGSTGSLESCPRAAAGYYEPAAGIVLRGADGVVEGCDLRDNGAGVWVDGAASARIGGPATAQHNTFTGNQLLGIVVTGAGLDRRSGAGQRCRLSPRYGGGAWQQRSRHHVGRDTNPGFPARTQIRDNSVLATTASPRNVGIGIPTTAGTEAVVAGNSVGIQFGSAARPMSSG